MLPGWLFSPVGWLLSTIRWLISGCLLAVSWLFFDSSQICSKGMLYKEKSGWNFHHNSQQKNFPGNSQ